ncbi:MAG TPA: DUF6259 domain-containing protein [Bryocella sp.]|nr:DUF6259 domain-containing protein [Bryocella sp.]
MAQILSGYSLESKRLVGPVQKQIATDPIWAVDYHTLVLQYRGSGQIAPEASVLALRPGSVGPVTPHADNPENPFASGGDIVPFHGSDLNLDGQPHTLRVDLASRLKTPQIDALEFLIPAGVQLTVDRLEFLADPGFLPCAGTSRNELPLDSHPLHVEGPLSCGDAVATSLRGREPLKIDARGSAATLYLDLYFCLEGFTNYIPSAPSRPANTSDPAFAIVNVRYADAPGQVEQQFPVLVAEHRHVLLNRKRSLYAVQLDPHRRLLSIELLDRSPHVQMLLYRAGLSNHVETAIDYQPAPTSTQPMSQSCTVASVLGGSPWFKMSGAESLKPSLNSSHAADGVDLSLSLANPTDHEITTTVSFPSLSLHIGREPADVSYLFPQKLATISSAEQALSADYGPNFLLQFTDIFSAQARCGAAVIVEDTSGQPKTFALAKAGRTILDPTDYVLHIPAHETYALPPVRIVLHNGDWHSGFRAYQEWLATWYKSRSARSAWLQNSFYMRRDYPVGGSGLLFDESHNRYTFGHLIQDGKAFGGIDFIDISGWALSETHGRVGDYPIELGGLENLRSNIADATSEHIPTGLYFEGYLIDKNSDVGRAHGVQWQIVGEDGKGLWWPHGSPEMFVCPRIPDWQRYLSQRMASTAKETGAQAVYLDEFGCRDRRCNAPDHGHPIGANMIPGEIGMERSVREALDAAGMTSTIVYTECPPVDIAAPFVDGSFTYALPSSTPSAYGIKLNLWRFAFPQVRLWDMVSAGVEPHIVSAEDFRYAFWMGDGVWLKGRSDTWYGQDALSFLRWAHPLLHEHAAAFAGEAVPLVSSPDSEVLINSFRGGGETVYTFFNGSYATKRLKFHGRPFTLAPRDVGLFAQPHTDKRLDK